MSHAGNAVDESTATVQQSSAHDSFTSDFETDEEPELLVKSGGDMKSSDEPAAAATAHRSLDGLQHAT